MSFRETVDTFIGTGADDAAAKLVGCAEEGPLPDDDILYLANALAESGDALPATNSLAADIASTGGPSSLSTLLCPLFLAAAGYVVPKLAVPGRPAGAIDVLAQVPGYALELSKNSVAKALRACRFAHFLARGRFAPRDGDLFAYRSRTGRTGIPELAIASILSKKIATSLSLVGLDVRVARHCNFGSSWQDALRNASRFVRVARRAGVSAACFLTDAMVPYQPFIGRGEALMALDDVLQGRAQSWLRHHLCVCRAMVKSLTGMSSTPDLPALASTFARHLQAQGASYEAFENRVQILRRSDRISVTASRDGFLVIDLAALREAIVRCQTSAAGSDTEFPDPAGVILAHRTGAYVHKGDELATVRSTPAELDEFRSRVVASLHVTENPGPIAGFEHVHDDRAVGLGTGDRE